MNIVKMCQVFLLEDGSILVEGTDFEPTGPGGLMSNARVRISAEAIDALLGIVVLKILEQTKVVRGADWDEKEVLAGRLTMTGTKSDRSFMSKSKCLLVSVVDSKIEIFSSKYQPDHGGWYSPSPRSSKCKPEPDQVHDLILMKLAECS